MRVMLLSADRTIGASLNEWLVERGHLLSRALRVADVAGAMDRGETDLVVVDLGSERVVDATIVNRLRSADASIPLLVLASGADSDDVVSLLEKGADRCLTQRFSMAELAANLRVWCRRLLGSPTRYVQRGSLRYDTESRTAWCGGAPLKLARSETLLLEALLRTHDRYTRKDRLMDFMNVHGYDVTSNGLEAHIHRLRDKLGRSELTIRASRGVGYRLEGA